MGEPIYKNLGFEVNATYVFYKRESAGTFRKVSNVQEMQKKDFPAVKNLDKEVTGEERFQFIERFLTTGWIYSNNKSDGIAGFYLPDLGGGLIIARTADAGLELMKMRLNRGKTTAVVPAANKIAREFLSSEGFKEFRTSSRMTLGNDVVWQPTMMFNRATGYSG